jgi:surface antigen
VVIVSDDDEGDAPVSKGNIISKWTYTKKVKNGFAVGYCTWYAAILRPDIFKYTDESKTVQERPFGGNANQWCTAAKNAGFRVGSTPAVGALIVYSKLRSSAGHVGKVIGMPGEGTLTVEDMNYRGKFVVTKRNEDANNSAIKCYIY